MCMGGTPTYVYFNPTLVHPSWISPCACPTGIWKPTGPQTDWDSPLLQICLPSYRLGVDDMSLPNPSPVSSASSVLSTCSVNALGQGPPPLARTRLQASLFCSPSPILLLLPGGSFLIQYAIISPSDSKCSGDFPFPSLSLALNLSWSGLLVTFPLCL